MVHVQRFGAYLLLEQLSHTSMTEVWTALRAGDASGSLVVLKRPRTGERATGAAASAVLRETELLREVGGGRIPRLVDAGEVAGLPFVVVEHVEGIDLAELGGDRLTPSEASAIASDLAASLAHLHGSGWVHGDVAPANVVVDDAGEARLIDFGIALRAGERRAHPAGKPGYVAPEVLAGGGADPAWDVFGLGVVTAELLAGARLFSDTDLADAVRRDAPRSLDDAPAWIARAIAGDPSVRPAAASLVSGEAVDPSVREALARRVLARRRSQERPRDVVLPAPVAAPARAPIVEPPPAGRSQGTGSRWRRVLIPLTGVLLLGAGAAAGHFATRAATAATDPSKRQARITFPLFPARTEIELDGRTVLVPEAGKAMPIEPGKHTLSIGAPRKERRSYDFVVEEGDNVLVLTLPGTIRDRGGDAK